MTGKRAGPLLHLMYSIEHFTLARAWHDLTDDEFFWEPFTITWSIGTGSARRSSEPMTTNSK